MGESRLDVIIKAQSDMAAVIQGVQRNLDSLKSSVDTLNKQSSTAGNAAADGIRKVGKSSLDSSSDIDKFAQQIAKSLGQDVGNVVGTLIGKMAQLTAAYMGFSAIIGYFRQLRAEGIAFNAQMETAQLGISGLLVSLGKVTDEYGKVVEHQEAFNVAMGISNELMTKLRIAGVQTSATTKELVHAYQLALGMGLSAKIDPDKMVQLVTKTSQAAGALGVQQYRLGLELNAMLTGNIIPEDRIAKALQLTPALVRQWKEQGVLFDKLNEKLADFAIMGDAITRTWDGFKSNLEDIRSVIAGIVTEGYFDQIKKAGLEAMGQVFDTSNLTIKEDFQDLVDVVKGAFTGIGEVMADSIRGAVEWIKEANDTLEKTGVTGEVLARKVHEVWSIFKAVGEAVWAIPMAVMNIIQPLADVQVGALKTQNTVEDIVLELHQFAVAVKEIGSVIGEFIVGNFRKALEMAEDLPGKVRAAGIAAGQASVDAYNPQNPYGSGTIKDLTPNVESRVAKAKDIFGSAGLSENGMAGLIGNLIHESGGMNSMSGKISGITEFGIAQWRAERKQALFNYAKEIEGDFTTLDTQLKFIVRELAVKFPDVLAALRDPSISVAKATDIVMKKYEIPKNYNVPGDPTANYANRLRQAMSARAALQGDLKYLQKLDQDLRLPTTIKQSATDFVGPVKPNLGGGSVTSRDEPTPEEIAQRKAAAEKIYGAGEQVRQAQAERAYKDTMAQIELEKNEVQNTYNVAKNKEAIQAQYYDAMESFRNKSLDAEKTKILTESKILQDKIAHVEGLDVSDKGKVGEADKTAQLMVLRQRLTDITGQLASIENKRVMAARDANTQMAVFDRTQTEKKQADVKAIQQYSVEQERWAIEQELNAQNHYTAMRKDQLDIQLNDRLIKEEQYAAGVAAIVEQQTKDEIAAQEKIIAVIKKKLDLAAQEAFLDDGKDPEKIKRNMTEQLALVNQLSEAEQKLAQSKERAALTIKKAQDDANKATQKASEFTIQMARNIQTELGDTLYQTMQSNFDNILQSWIQLIERMLAQAMAAQLGEYLFGKDISEKGTGKIGGLFGDIMDKVRGIKGETPTKEGGSNTGTVDGKTSTDTSIEDLGDKLGSYLQQGFTGLVNGIKDAFTFITNIFSQLFGGGGGAGNAGGVLGALGGLFGGGGSGAGAAAGAAGGAAASGSGVMDILYGIGNFFGGFFAEGGRINGPGTGTSDSVPIWASNGEFMINAEQTARFLPLLEAINSGRIGALHGGISLRSWGGRNFASGGMVAAHPVDNSAPGKAPIEERISVYNLIDKEELRKAVLNDDATTKHIINNVMANNKKACKRAIE